jgi:hypothetical protein
VARTGRHLEPEGEDAPPQTAPATA